MNEVNNRINSLVKERKTSFYKLSKETGIDQSVFSRVKTGKLNFSSKNIEQIANYFGVNIDWLLTGEGDMLKTPSKEGKGNDTTEEANLTVGKVIPLYDAETAAGNGYEVDMSPARVVDTIEIGSLLRDSEAALRIYGNSMVPNYPSGCVVGLRPHTDNFIEPGQVYVVETRENRYLKRLFYNADHSAFRCVSDNHVTFDSGPMKGEFCFPEFEIPFEAVRRLFRVVGVIKRNII